MLTQTQKHKKKKYKKSKTKKQSKLNQRCFNDNALQGLTKTKDNEKKSDGNVSQAVNETYYLVLQRGTETYVNDYANIAMRQSLNLCVFNACTQLNNNDQNFILSKNNVNDNLNKARFYFQTYATYRVKN